MAEQQQIVLEIGSPEGPPKHVRIDGVDYRLRDADTFSLIEQHSLVRGGKALITAGNPEATDAELVKAVAGLDGAVRMVFGDLPDEVFAKLSDNQKAEIVLVFIKESKDERTARRERAESLMRSNEPRDSSDSMAEVSVSG